MSELLIDVHLLSETIYIISFYMCLLAAVIYTEWMTTSQASNHVDIRKTINILKH